MSKSLKDIVTRTASSLGLAGILAMSSGCIGSAIITGYGAQCGQPGAYAFGNALNQTEAAREGKTTVNVYNGGQNQDSPVAYPTSRDDGIAYPQISRATASAIYVDKKTGRKYARQGSYNEFEIGEKDIIEGDNLIHVGKNGRRELYVKEKFGCGERYKFLGYLKEEKEGESKEKPREESKDKPQSNPESKEVF